MTTSTEPAGSPFRGGVASSQGLYRAGFGKPEIRRALRAGGLHRVRRGWYSVAHPHEAVRRAVGAGGVLACQSALAFHGVWVPDLGAVHARRSEHGRRGPRSAAVRFCQPSGLFPAPTHAVDDVEMALRTAMCCANDQDLVVLMDSVLHLGLLSLTQLRYCLDGGSSHHRGLIDRCDRAESGTETLTRLALRSRGIKMRPQVFIPGVGRVDFVIGRCLVIEVDSKAYHSDPASYLRDRVRDQKLIGMGYFVVRLTYEQVMFDLAATIDRLLPVIRRESHRRQVRLYGEA